MPQSSADPEHTRLLNFIGDATCGLTQSEEAREDAEAIAEERCAEFADAEAALDELEAQEADALELLRGDVDVRHVRQLSTVPDVREGLQGSRFRTKGRDYTVVDETEAHTRRRRCWTSFAAQQACALHGGDGFRLLNTSRHSM